MEFREQEGKVLNFQGYFHFRNIKGITKPSEILQQIAIVQGFARNKPPICPFLQ